MEKKTIGAFIAALRKANGYTQEALAEKLNVSNKAVSRWERDECAPDISLIPLIAEVFNVTCDELLKGERITSMEERSVEPKVERNIKGLINRALSNNKYFIYSFFACLLVGVVLCFGISYGFYKPILGFSLLVIFVVAALIALLIGVNQLSMFIDANELIDSVDISLKKRMLNALGKTPYNCAYLAFSSIVLTIPLVAIDSVYANSVLTFSSYIVFFIVLVYPLLIGYFAFRELFIANAARKYSFSEYSICKKSVSQMNAYQLGLYFAVAVISIVLPYVFASNRVIEYHFFVPLAICLVSAALSFGIYYSCSRSDDDDRLYKKYGLSNLLVSIPQIIFACLAPKLIKNTTHSSTWGIIEEIGGEIITGEPVVVTNNIVVWNVLFTLLAIAVALVIFIARTPKSEK